MTLVMPRRRFLAGLVGLIAAPAVVRAASLMKIVAIPSIDCPYGFSPAMKAFADMKQWEEIRMGRYFLVAHPSLIGPLRAEFGNSVDFFEQKLIPIGVA